MAHEHPEPAFDAVAAHRFFSADCFNRAWELIDKPHRTSHEDLELVALNQASIFHWQQRADCTDTHRSIGYWQASRIQALLGNAAEARRHAQTSLAFAEEAAPFYRGYAYEAFARAEKLAGDTTRAAEYAAMAQAEAQNVSETVERTALLADLARL